jgi:hypothetical protein
MGQVADEQPPPLCMKKQTPIALIARMPVGLSCSRKARWSALHLVRMLYECGRFREIPEMWRIVELVNC